MQVRMLSSRFAANGALSYVAGTQYDIPDDLALQFIGAGVAVDVGDSRAVANRTQRDEPTPAEGIAQIALVSNAWIQTTDGGIHTLSEVQPVVAATGTGTAFSGACLFRGLVVRAIVGTPQTVTVFDALSATGTPIATFTVAALGTYFWDGDQVTVGNGRGGRRQCTTGVHVVFSGGTSRTVDVMVESAA